MKDSMKTWLNPICVVTGVKCSTCSSLTHLSADSPVMLKSQEKIEYTACSVTETNPGSMRKRGKKKKAS